VDLSNADNSARMHLIGADRKGSDREAESDPWRQIAKARQALKKSFWKSLGAG
jgi:hypothetical protein